MSVHLLEQHLSLAERLVAKAHSNGGLAKLDVERFWADDAKAGSNPWADDCPQVPLGIRMSNECVFDELGVPADWHRLAHDEAYRVDLEHRYNDKAELIVGRRLLGEVRSDPRHAWPGVKELYDIFEARNVWHDWSYWLQQSAHGEDELKALLDRVEKRLENLREFLLPPGWAEAKARITALGGQVPLYRGQRGPVTFATSVYGPEPLIFLIIDNPGLAGRFRDLILRAILERARILDEEAGHTPATAPHGWWWADDNCALLNAEMYEFFGWPILKGVFDRYSPAATDLRFQHSDSDMGHLLPLLGRLGLTACNLGPNLTVTGIREHLPRAVIQGQLAPFTFSRNEEVNMVAEFLRDVEMAREKRGLVFTTAGSINAGSKLTGMRLLMAAIQEHGRYA
ncbi:MAG: uroporphyrinogen decarboxylase family protein [bacterium]